MGTWEYIGIGIVVILGILLTGFLAAPTGSVSSPRKSKNKPRIVQRSKENDKI